jgi:hypothetical protein
MIPLSTEGILANHTGEVPPGRVRTVSEHHCRETNNDDRVPALQGERVPLSILLVEENDRIICVDFLFVIVRQVAVQDGFALVVVVRVHIIEFCRGVYCVYYAMRFLYRSRESEID